MNNTFVQSQGSIAIQNRKISAFLPLVGIAFITLVSQLKIDLAFTPVPITGQTFAVILWGMLFGKRQGVLAATGYLTAGAAGLPVFAGFATLPALWGPTSGYLVGFIPGAWLAGWLAERTPSRHVVTGTLIGIVAHVPILLCGALVMSSFVGMSQILALAIAPFLIGDVIKSVVAGTIYATSARIRNGAR